MGLRQRERIEQCTCKQVNPNIFRRALVTFKLPIENVLISSLAALNNEERKTVKAHQLEAERKQLVAIIQARHGIFR